MKQIYKKFVKICVFHFFFPNCSDFLIKTKKNKEMKRILNQFMPLTCLLFLLLSTASYAQDISEADKKEQEEVLKQDPRDFAANFILGGYYYNLAIEPHKETTKMRLVEYLDEGEPFEKKKNGYLKQALPYFENCYAIGKDGDPRVKATLKKKKKFLKSNSKQ